MSFTPKKYIRMEVCIKIRRITISIRREGGREKGELLDGALLNMNIIRRSYTHEGR